MFPSQDSSTTSITETSTSNDIGQGVILSYNFEAGEFDIKDGKPVELTGLEGLKMWIKKVLRTDKHKFKIYTGTDSTYAYGITLLDYIKLDLPFDFKKAEIQREITETLMVNTSINSVSDFSFERKDDILNISFTVNSVYGTTQEGVSTNGID